MGEKFRLIPNKSIIMIYESPLEMHERDYLEMTFPENHEERITKEEDRNIDVISKDLEEKLTNRAYLFSTKVYIDTPDYVTNNKGKLVEQNKIFLTQGNHSQAISLFAAQNKQLLLQAYASQRKEHQIVFIQQIIQYLLFQKDYEKDEKNRSEFFIKEAQSQLEHIIRNNKRTNNIHQMVDFMRIKADMLYTWSELNEDSNKAIEGLLVNKEIGEITKKDSGYHMQEYEFHILLADLDESQYEHQHFLQAIKSYDKAIRVDDVYNEEENIKTYLHLINTYIHDNGASKEGVRNLAKKTFSELIRRRPLHEYLKTLQKDIGNLPKEDDGEEFV